MLSLVLLFLPPSSTPPFRALSPSSLALFSSPLSPLHALPPLPSFERELALLRSLNYCLSNEAFHLLLSQPSPGGAFSPYLRYLELRGLLGGAFPPDFRRNRFLAGKVSARVRCPLCPGGCPGDEFGDGDDHGVMSPSLLPLSSIESHELVSWPTYLRSFSSLSPPATAPEPSLHLLLTERSLFPALSCLCPAHPPLEIAALVDRCRLCRDPPPPKAGAYLTRRRCADPQCGEYLLCVHCGRQECSTCGKLLCASLDCGRGCGSCGDTQCQACARIIVGGVVQKPGDVFYEESVDVLCGLCAATAARDGMRAARGWEEGGEASGEEGSGGEESGGGYGDVLGGILGRVEAIDGVGADVDEEEEGEVEWRELSGEEEAEEEEWGGGESAAASDEEDELVF
ncbi:hypothetical protein TeGR_g4841 [Tetraparma gracilis]|uniref:Uncharacterized protein n=1 Tax=Tetraparma gracilis TaxID=2962635 RepID=A0ABQ6N8W9_9STRA|nr:hypothetical protein TeGR_g4841 [Tetraparma gracilis]